MRPPPLPEQASPPSLWTRFASICYEAVSLVPILFIAGYLFLALAHEARSLPMRTLFQFWVLTWVGAYFVYCWTKSGQTLAMKAWRLRVETMHGQRLSVAQAVVRYLAAVLGLALLGVGFLWMLVDPQRQFLHDRLLRTRVVRAD
ncbi:MAG: RDD family protein [Burkholderiales bacterium]|nr:RDD family protein [Burkholderiales bacterium]